MSTSLSIDTEDLTKVYGQDRGVQHLDLDVRAGEVFGFLGPNGAGKSTTIHLLVGMLGLLFGTLALAIGAATGSKARASGITVAVALGTYLIDALANLVGWMEPFALVHRSTGTRRPTRSWRASRRSAWSRWPR